MKGKKSIKHIFNDNRSTQMTPSEFVEFLKDANNNSINSSWCQITEKIDGSSQFFGIDSEGPFWEKFAIDGKIREIDESNPFVAPYKRLFDNFKKNANLLTYLNLLRETNEDEVKFQAEVVYNDASVSQDTSVTKIVCVPYDKSCLGQDGLFVVVKVLRNLIDIDDTRVVSNVARKLQDFDKGLKVVVPTPLEYESIGIKDLLDTVNSLDTEIITSRKKIDRELKLSTIAKIQDVQKQLRDRVSERFPSGNYGPYYEGLVLKTDNFFAKVTSPEFQKLFAEHNN